MRILPNKQQFHLNVDKHIESIIFPFSMGFKNVTEYAGRYYAVVSFFQSLVCR